MPENKKRLLSIVPIFAALAVSPLVKQTVVATVIVSLSLGRAVAGSPVRMDAPALLNDMRASLGEIAFSFSEAKGETRSRSGVAVLAALTEATRSVQSLEAAIASRESSRISRTTKALSRAVGNLQTRYSLSSAKCYAATRALQRFNAAWAEYSRRFVLARHKEPAANVAASDVEALKKRVADLSYRMQQLEDDVADNAALRTEVIRMRREIAIAQLAPASTYGYQRLSFTLTVLSGSFAALSLTAREYYPSYYVRITDFESNWSIDSYWDGYYDGYYQGVADSYYSEPVIISAPIMTESRAEIYQNVTYETIYNVTNETTNIYQTMPEEDLSNVAVSALPPGVNFSVEDAPINQILGAPEVQALRTDVPDEEPAAETMPYVTLETDLMDQPPDVSGDQDEPSPAIPSALEQHPNAADVNAFNNATDSSSLDHGTKAEERDDRLSQDHSTQDALPPTQDVVGPSTYHRLLEDDASQEEPVVDIEP